MCRGRSAGKLGTIPSATSSNIAFLVRNRTFTHDESCYGKSTEKYEEKEKRRKRGDPRSLNGTRCGPNDGVCIKQLVDYGQASMLC